MGWLNAVGKAPLLNRVKRLVVFVAGPESSYITGANLTVDGGMNA